MSSKMKKRNQEVVQQSQWRPTAMNRVEDTKISKLEKLVTRISFGIVLVELLTRKEHRMATIAEGSANSNSNLVEWIINLVSTSFSLQDVVDDSLIGLGFNSEIFEFMNIACKYIQSVPEQRPTMLELYQTMRATGEKHGLVDDSEMWKEIEIATASASEGDVEIIG